MSHRSRLRQATENATEIPAPRGQLFDLLLGERFMEQDLEDQGRLPILLLTPTWTPLVMVDPTEDDTCFVWQHPNGELVATVRAFTDGEMVPFTIPVSHRATYETNPDSSMKRYAMRQIGPHTWAISPSVNIPGLIHAFVVLCDVPEPAPWGRS